MIENLEGLSARDKIVFWGSFAFGIILLIASGYYFFYAGDHALGISLLALWVAIQAYVKDD